MTNLQLRAITGSIYVSVMLLFSFLGGEYTASLFFLFFLLCSFEFLLMLSKRFKLTSGHFFLFFSVNIFSFGAVLAYYLLGSAHGLRLLLIWPVVVMTYGLLSRNDNNLEIGVWLLFGTLYLGVGLISLAVIGQKNPLLLLFIYGVIWSNDSFAYLIGRKFGRRKLLPTVSPGKTWEGTIGGVIMALVLMSCLEFMAIELTIQLGYAFWQLALMTTVIAVLATIGDLVESQLKRFFQVKDSSNLLPGHGGFMDRLDSLIFVGPFILLFIFLL